MAVARVTSVAFHRNGVGGEPCYFATIVEGKQRLAEDAENSIPWSRTGRCYVIDPALAAEGVISFGENSWRGDRYEALVAIAVRKEAADMLTAMVPA